MNLDKRFEIIRSEGLERIHPTKKENQIINARVSQVSRILDE